MPKNMFEEAAARVFASKTGAHKDTTSEKEKGSNSFDEELKKVDLSGTKDMLIAGGTDVSDTGGFEGVAYVENIVQSKFKDLHNTFKTLDSYRNLSSFLDMMYESGRDLNFKTLADLALYFYYQK